MFNTLGNSIPRNGLVGERLLDGNALDTSGNGNNGTATNITYIKTDKGYQSQAGSYNGSNSNINLGTNKFPTLVNNCTFTAWIRNNSNSTTQSIFSNGNNGTGGDLGWYFGIKLDGVNNTYNFTKPGIINENTGITPSVGKDDFICLTITSNIGRLYINSVLVWTGVNSSAISNNTQTAKIGCHTISSSNTQFYNGNIQGVRIYNRVLSQDEITLLYLEGQRQLGPTATPKYPALLSGLVGYWDFRGSAHNLVDGSLATVTGATLTQDRFGNSNSSYSLNGTTGNIEQSYNSNFNITTGDFTISKWFKSTSTGTSMSFGGKQVLGAFNGFWIDKDSGGSITFYTFAGAGNSTTLTTANANAYFDGNRHNLIYQRRGSNLEVFLDGNLFGSTSGTIRDVGGNAPFTIGKRNNALYFNGTFGDCLFFNKALSADEAKLLYNLTSQDYIYPTPSYDIASLRDGLVLDLNEQGYDLSGNGNNGTLVNSPAVIRQGRAKGLSYNGSNQSNVTGNVNLFGGSNNFTIAMWIKPGNSQVAYADICDYDHNNATHTNRGFVIQQNNTTLNQYSMTVYGTGTPGDGLVFTTLTANVWQSFILVKNGNTITHYVNGIQTGTGSQAVTLNNPTVPFRISGLQTGGGRLFNGQIISPKIRNRVLSDKEIQALYYSQKGNFIY